jgi:hypothetical protein
VSHALFFYFAKLALTYTILRSEYSQTFFAK